ncbi:MAG: type II toxin-antitoxin system RelE/ParE family toxin [Clostridioides sp.]|jgi:mRNA interferase RelE/StbE|nr:type II toxin-antitoxin system RelE/ParE family toxin [Clostridioides sp.]
MENPLRYKKLSQKHRDSFRIRAGNYRIVYQIEKDEIIVLVVGHRKNIYDILIYLMNQ